MREHAIALTDTTKTKAIFAQTLAQCNTALYVQTVNQQGGICGFSDWQLPTKAQLTTIE